MSRADRWWRPTSKRPPVRARTRMYRYNQYDVNLAYDRGIMRGTRDTAERHQRRDQLNADFDLVEQAHLRDPERFRQLAEAIEMGGEEGKEALEALAREWGVFPEDDDLFDVADAAGVLDEDEDRALWESVKPIGDEAEEWLAQRDDWLNWLREQDGGE